MRTRKWLAVLTSVLALGAGTPASAADHGNAEGCSPLGSWIGFDTAGTAYWTASFYGQTASSGVEVLDIPGLDPSWLIPSAVRVSTFRGTWQRTGGNTIAASLISLALGSAGQTVAIVKFRVVDTLMENCSTLVINNTAELFLPDANPFQSDPYAVIPLPEHYGYRMRVDLPSN